MTNLDDFLAGYAEALVWANAYVPSADDPSEYVPQGDGGPSVTVEYAGGFYAVSDDPNLTAQEIDLTDARAFYAAESANLWATGQTDFSQHGHDFALTRNGHGTGFWDRGYGEVGLLLTDAADTYGTHEIIF